MNSARIFKIGECQAVELPEEFQFESNEVYSKRVGKNIILTAKGDSWAGLIDSLSMFSDDFMAERQQPPALWINPRLSEKKRQPIGSLHMLIAAHASSLSLTLVTNNLKEFKRFLD